MKMNTILALAAVAIASVASALSTASSVVRNAAGSASAGSFAICLMTPTRFQFFAATST